LNVEEFGVVKVRRQVIEQAREFEQVRAPVHVINLTTALRDIRFEAIHFATTLFFNNLVLRARQRIAPPARRDWNPAPKPTNGQH
jgi:hypothetical protein